MVGRLRRVVMRRPGEAMAAADPARVALHRRRSTSRRRARAHDAFADALRAWDVEVLYHDEPLPEHADSVFVFDPVARHRPRHARAQHGQGAAPRRGGAARRARCRTAACRVFGRLEGDARVRGRRHPVAGPRHARGGPRLPHERRRRPSAPRPARPARRHGARLRPARTSPARRPACTCSASISPVDVDLAVAYPPLMPTAFWAELRRRGVRLLEVPEEEFVRTQATNVLTVAPRRVHHAGREPGDAAAARDGGLRGRHLPRRAALVQGRGRADLPHAAGAARPGVSEPADRGAASLSRRLSARAARGAGPGRPRRLPARARSRSPASTARRRPAQRRVAAWMRERGPRDRRLARSTSRARAPPRLVPRGRARRGPGRRRLVGEPAAGRAAEGGAAGRDLLLNGHIDVVPVGDEAAWTTPPWDPAVRDGRVYGRGAVDMKGGLCCALFAAKAIRDAGVRLRGRVWRRQRRRRGGRRHRHAGDAPARAHRATAPSWWSRRGCAWSRRRRAR